jgi:glycosyltransferase involved in cell wall biosynthesis
MIKIVHLITDLSTGGAEMMLYKLLSRLDRRFCCQVVCMTDAGTLGHRIEALGLRVTTLGMSRGLPSLRGIWHFYRLVRKERPHIVQTWLYHADLLGLMVGKGAGVPAIAWNVRCSNMDMRHYRTLSGMTFRLLAKLSVWPDVVVTNSEAGRRFHEMAGFHPRRWAVIPNGFDVERFLPDPAARRKLRSELSCAADVCLIGMIARDDPMKDHPTFLKAARRLASGAAEVQFVLAGLGMDLKNRDLTQKIESLGLSRSIHLLGERNDVQAVMAALDIATVSSAYGEGFPNVLGEAMACGIPCVATDVGDAAVLIGATGKVVPPRNPEALAGAWEELIARGPDGRRRLGEAARERVKAHYDLPMIVKQYEQCYESLASSG